MRLELNKNLKAELNKIKKEHSWECSNRGHVQTVEFLVRYYRQHKKIERLRNEITESIANLLSIL